MKILKFIPVLLLLAGFATCKTQNSTVQLQTETAVVDQPKSVNVRGEKLRYVEKGEGEPLIFIHGSLGDYRTWISRMGPYSKDYHVVSYSRRHAWPNKQVFDESLDYSARIHADDLYALIQKIGFKKVHLVGHSYGAFTALTMALDHPEVVQSVVLGEPPAASLLENSARGKASFDKFQKNNILPAAQAFRDNKNEEGVERFLQGVMGDDFSLNEVPLEVRQGWMDNVLETWGQMLSANTFFPLDPGKIQTLEVPVLLFVGDRSPQWFIEVSKELDRLLPNSRLETLENSSHGLMFHNPEDFDRAVMQFLAKH